MSPFKRSFSTFSIYTLSDLGDLSNLIGSLSRTIQQYSPPGGRGRLQGNRWFSPHASMTSCLASVTFQGRMEKPESGIRNRSRKRNRNLRNKNWRRFCLEIVTNNYCSIKTFHSHIIFIHCYYIFYCRIFCVRRKIFLREYHIRVIVVTWDHDWHEYSSFLCRLSLTMDVTRSPFKKWVT